MPRLNLLHSGAFRLALVFSGLFAVGAFVLVIAVDIAVSRYADQTTRSALLDESALLRSEASLDGPAALAPLIQRRLRIAKTGQYLYRLSDARGRLVLGELPDAAARVGWGEVSMAETPDPLEPEGEKALVRTYGVRLGEGSLLVVGRNTYDLEELGEWLERVTIWSGVGVTVLALGGGLLIAAIFLRRLERVNRSLQGIMDGQLDQRVPPIGMGGEFARLTAGLNRMLERIEALMNGLRQVSTDIAHDLRTPLTRLRQHLETTRTRSADPTVEAAIDDALGQVDEVLSTFNALLRIGQIEAGAGRARFETVDLSEVVERVRLAYTPAAEDAGKILTADIAPGVSVMGDAGLLTQLFANLLENALAHTGAGARIGLGLAAWEGKAMATVGDDGPGIPEPERERVLRRFHRLDASRNTPGAGLGLSLVSAIAGLHGADLRLGDNHPGLAVRVGFPAKVDGRAGGLTSG